MADTIGNSATAKIVKGQILGDQPLVVAVKVFGILGKVGEELLIRELRATHQVALHRHPSILPFIGTADVGQHKAIVSHYMQNGNLLLYLKNHHDVDRRQLILEVAEAVAYLHDIEGLMHGDLKCENVLISDSGRALLADFGLSTLVEKTTTRTITAIRNMNTIRFAAPELHLGSADPAAPPSPKTRQTDVFAFGMLILEAVTGQPPFPKLNDVAALFYISTGKLPSRPTRNGLVIISRSWWEICIACWRFNAKHRPAMRVVWQILAKCNLLPSRKLIGYRGSVRSVAYMPCGRRIVSASADAVQIRDIITAQIVVGSKRSDGESVYSLAVAPNGRQIASRSYYGTIWRWDALSGTPVGQPMTKLSDNVFCVAYSPDSKLLVSGSQSRMLRLWDARTGEAIGELMRGHTDFVQSVAFSPDGSRIVSGSWDATIRIWDAATGAHLATLSGHSDKVTSVSYLPDGHFIVSASWDKTIKVWNADTLQFRHTMRGHTDRVYSVSVSPSGKYIASGSADMTVRIWSAEIGEPVGAPLVGHAGYVLSVAFSPDGKSLVSGSTDGTVRIWDLFE